MYVCITRISLSVIMAYNRSQIDPQHVYKNVLYNVGIIIKYYFEHTGLGRNMLVTTVLGW